MKRRRKQGPVGSQMQSSHAFSLCSQGHTTLLTHQRVRQPGSFSKLRGPEFVLGFHHVSTIVRVIGHLVGHRPLVELSVLSPLASPEVRQISHVCKMISHYRLDLHFSNDQ